MELLLVVLACTLVGVARWLTRPRTTLVIDEFSYVHVDYSRIPPVVEEFPATPEEERP